MTYYGAKDLAASFRTVRKNTVTIAEDIPEDQYGYRPTPDSKTVSEILTHIALGSRFQEQVVLIDKRTTMVGFDYFPFRERVTAEMNQPRTKAEIVTLLQTEGEKYASAVEGLTDEFIGGSIAMPPGGVPPSRSRFDMLLSVKEHEMHHRAQLMLIQRLLGITPHLTREHQARLAAMMAARNA